MGNPSPVRMALRKIVADGKWHSRDDLVNACAHLIPTDRCLAYARQYPRTGQLTNEQLIFIGQSHYVRECISSMTAKGELEVTKTHVRSTEVKSEEPPPVVPPRQQLAGEGRRSPWTLAILNLMADGEWRSRDEIVNACHQIVPPSKAIRWADRNPRANPLAYHERIFRGQSHYVRDAIQQLSTHGHIEVDPDTFRVRLKPTFAFRHAEAKTHPGQPDGLQQDRTPAVNVTMDNVMTLVAQQDQVPQRVRATLTPVLDVMDVEAGGSSTAPAASITVHYRLTKLKRQTITLIFPELADRLESGTPLYLVSFNPSAATVLGTDAADRVEADSPIEIHVRSAADTPHSLDRHATS